MTGGRLWAPLRSADYARLWLGQLISVIGDKIDQIALGILVYEVTGSELQMGISLAISMLPAAIFGMMAGAYVDRWDRRRTMIVADLARAVLVCMIPFAVGVGLWLVYLIALAVATMSLFFEPAKLALIPDLVKSDELQAANSLDNATVSVAELLGLAFAAGLVALLGYRVAFFLDGVTYLVSAVAIALIAHRSVAGSGAVPGLRAVAGEAIAGARYVVRHGVLRDLLVMYSAAAAGIAASVTLVYVLALDRFKAGAPGLATLDGAITVGLLVGTLAIGYSSPGGSGRKLLTGLLAFGLLFPVAALMPSLLLAVPFLILGGIANMFFYVPIATLLQTSSEPEMRGRVFAAKQTTTRILSVFGFVGGGALAQAVGFVPTVLAVSGLIVIAAAWGWTRPRLRAC